MITNTSTKEEMNATYEKAYQKTQELKSFYYSLILYIVIMSGLVYIWYEFTSHTIQWFWFPILGWGIGLVFQGLKVFNKNLVFGTNWEEKQIKKYMEDTIVHPNKKSDTTKYDEPYQRAKKRVETIKGFYGHLFVYLVINTFIVSTIVYTTRVDIFSFAAMSTPIFWGIGLLFHALGVFGRNLLFSKNWEKRQIETFMNKEKEY